ncbi:MAG: AtzE family amidohydrolase, partial [Pseudomonadota bacterium]
TLAGSRINADDPPATVDATALARLKAAGAVCLGATNMGEYAYDFVTANHHYGATLNPHAPERSAGGSSGGSAAAVAAGLTTLALGTDTNGSIRVPASFCGLWGFKPSYGRLSRAGSFLFVGSLDTVGVFGRHVDDLALAYTAMAGPDPRDPVCWPAAEDDPELALPPGSSAAVDTLAGVRIARLGGYFEQTAAPSIDAAVDTVADALGVRHQRELPHPELARTAAFAITAAEGGALHRNRLSRRSEDFDPASRDRLLAGALLPAGWYLKAQRFRRWWQQQLREAFRVVDVFIAPATPLLAPSFTEEWLSLSGRRLPLRPNIGLFTQPITLVGLPVVAAPVHAPGVLPTAVQLIGRPGSERLLLRTARVLEQLGACTAPVVG